MCSWLQNETGSQELYSSRSWGVTFAEGFIWTSFWFISSKIPSNPARGKTTTGNLLQTLQQAAASFFKPNVSGGCASLRAANPLWWGWAQRRAELGTVVEVNPSHPTSLLGNHKSLIPIPPELLHAPGPGSERLQTSANLRSLQRGTEGAGSTAGAAHTDFYGHKGQVAPADGCE